MMMGYGFGFDLFPILFSLAFTLILAIFAVTAFKGIAQWNKNNHAPKLTVDASVVAKRTNHRRSHHNGHHHTTTSYFVTFQVESGDRMEFHMDGFQYGMLVEGDKGKLTFQGTRYLGFERT